VMLMLVKICRRTQGSFAKDERHMYDEATTIVQD